MPQLDFFSYYHQLVSSFSLFFYIFFVFGFFIGPSVFLRSRLVYLIEEYSLNYARTMFSLCGVFSSFGFTAFKSVSLPVFTSQFFFYKKEKLNFFFAYFNEYSALSTLLLEKKSFLSSNLTEVSGTELTDQTYFFDLLAVK